MKISFLRYLLPAAISFMACSNDEKSFASNNPNTTKITSQTVDSLWMSYLKDTVISILHENEIHQVSVMQFTMENNTNIAADIVLTKNNWIASEGTTSKYLNGAVCTDLTDYLNTKLLRVDAYSSCRLIFPKEDSLLSLNLTIHYFKEHHEESKYKYVVIEFGPKIDMLIQP